MVFPSSLSLFFSLSHLFIFLHLVEGQDNLPHACPKEFTCGKLGNMSFPFTEYDEPFAEYNETCGLCLVDCHAPKPRINLWGEKTPPEYWPFIVNYSEKQIQIEVTKNCELFQNFTDPAIEGISFTMASKLTPLLRCESSLSDSEISKILPSSWKFSHCEKFVIYYNKSENTISAYSGRIPPHCFIIQLPVGNRNLDQHNFYDNFANEISLEWSLTGSSGCSECSAKGKVKKLGLILGLGGTVTFLIVICGILFMMWQRKKRNKDGTYLLSRNISSDPSSRADIEVESVRFGVPIYTYAELEKATASFDSANELGDGGFGIVYLGKLQDGREVAVKRLYEHNYKRMEHFMNEIKILTSLRHPNLVSLYGCTSRRSRELLLVYEYVPNGTVADHIHGSKAGDKLLTWQIRMNIAIETANALTYLHKSEIIHRDVKTNNILLDHNFSVKVADFGLSRLFPLDATHVSTAPQGTPGYVDPEYHECYQLTVKSDVYSFGVVLIELISSLPAVDISRHRHDINLSNLAISRIQRNAVDELIDSSLGYGSDPEVTRMTSSIAELAYRCLQVEKEMRPSMDEVLEILEAIKEGKDSSESKEVREVRDKSCVEKGVGIPPSPESDETVLLKNNKFPTSPISVTENCFSGSSLE